MKLKITHEQWEEINNSIARVKVLVGIANNASWAACLDAYDHIKLHPHFNKQCKGNTTPHKEFEEAFTRLKKYERQLKYTSVHNMFLVSQLSPESRKKYGDITNEQLYDIWTSTGANVYQANFAFYTSLVNKQRLACLNHGIAAPEQSGWALAASNALCLATESWKTTMKVIVDTSPLLTKTYGKARIEDFYKEYFKDFYLKDVFKSWGRATMDLIDKNEELTELEEKNIIQGYRQLADKWFNCHSINEGRVKSVKDYAEVWRTPGEMKKIIREHEMETV